MVLSLWAKPMRNDGNYAYEELEISSLALESMDSNTWTRSGYGVTGVFFVCLIVPLLL
jgi:hypothetical protein